MSEPETLDRKDDAGPQIESEGEPHPADLLVSLVNADSGGARRPAGSLSTAAEGGPPAPSPVQSDAPRFEEVQSAARALAAQPATAQEPDSSGLLRTVQAVRAVLPFVQRLLPLLDGNVIAAVANLLAPRPSAPAHAKPVDLGPLENGLAELKTQQREMRGLMVDQDSAVKRLAEQVELVRRATDLNTTEQQELIDELKAASRKVNIVAFLAFALLAASIALNVALYLQIHRVMP